MNRISGLLAKYVSSSVGWDKIDIVRFRDCSNDLMASNAAQIQIVAIHNLWRCFLWLNISYNKNGISKKR